MVSLDPEGTNVEVGDQVLVAGQKHGIVRFYGKTDFAPGVCVCQSDHLTSDSLILNSDTGSEEHPVSFQNKRPGSQMVSSGFVVSVVLQVIGSAWSWISPQGNTTARCLESATSAACPNMGCLLRPLVSRGNLEAFFFFFFTFLFTFNYKNKLG